MKKISDEERIEKICKEFLDPMMNTVNEEIKKSKSRLPQIEERERVVQNGLEIGCAFRFLVDLESAELLPLTLHDERFPFDNIIKLKDFLYYVHPAYLTPYLLFGGLAHELTKEAEMEIDDFLKYNYQIMVPLKLPGQQIYSWYLQISKMLTITEYKAIISHCNYYQYIRPAQVTEKIEHQYIGATVLKGFMPDTYFENKLNEHFTAFLKQRFNATQWNVLNNIHQNRLDNNDEEQKSVGLKSKNSIYGSNKKISDILEELTGYSFGKIDNIRIYLRNLGVI